MLAMENFTPTTTTSSSTEESSKINSAMVDKIADIFAQINAKKAEVSNPIYTMFLIVILNFLCTISRCHFPSVS